MNIRGLLDLSVVTDLLSELYTEYIHLYNRNPVIEQMFRSHVRDMMLPRVKTLLVGYGALVALFWPTDFLFFEGEKVLRGFSIWRSATIFVCFGGYFFLDYADTLRPVQIWSLISVIVLLFAISGFVLGSVRGMNSPWFYLSFLVPLISTVVSLDLFQRILMAVSATVSYVIPYVYASGGFSSVTHGEQILFIGSSSVIVNVMVGHVLFTRDRLNYFQQRELDQQRQKVQRLAWFDQLTGLYNRREFEERFKEKFEHAIRYGRRLSILMVDLDHFKEINDSYGHQVGDHVLQGFGKLIDKNIRQSDIAGRYGGEEFAIVLPETPLEGAAEFARRLKKQFSSIEFEADDGSTFSVTCSIGVVGLSDEENLQELLKESDQCLYEAKEAGRNCVITA